MIKRDIFKFMGEQDMALNLEHVTSMQMKENKIEFRFYNHSILVDLGTLEKAKEAFDALIVVWSSGSTDVSSGCSE